MNELDPTHYLTSIAFNAVTAAMAAQGRTLMTANDAQRVAAIFRLLHLERDMDTEPVAPGQVVAQAQPPRSAALDAVEQAIGSLAESASAL